MKEKNGLKIAHWILIFLSTASVVVGFIVCAKNGLKPSEMIPSITGFFTLITTIVIDMIGSKKEKSKNTGNDIKAGKDVIIGNNNDGSKSDHQPGSVENTGENIEAKGSVIIGNNNRSR